MAPSYRLDTCWLCVEPMNESKEHVLPEAITYDNSLQFVGFICKECNNRTGTQWDADLANACQLVFRGDQNYLANLRKSGRTRIPTDFITFDGEIIEGTTDYEGNFREKRSRPVETEKDDGYISVFLQGSRDDKKFLEQMENVRKRFQGPKEEVIETETLYGVPSHEIQISKEKIRKSLIKSYMALAYHVGIDPNICGVSMPYLRGETSQVLLQEPPMFMFRERDVHYRHIVLIYSASIYGGGGFLMGGAHISGFPLESNSRMLDGELYVESLVPALLSTRYAGPSTMKAYVVDVKDRGHQVQDIECLLNDGTLQFNPGQP